MSLIVWCTQHLLRTEIIIPTLVFQARHRTYRSSPPPDGPPYKCSQCSESLTTLQGYRYHIQRHSGLYPYYCPYCNKGISCTKDMKTHLKAKHTGVRGFTCMICRQEWQSVHELTAHVQQFRGMCGMLRPVLVQLPPPPPTDSG